MKISYSDKKQDIIYKRNFYLLEEMKYLTYIQFLLKIL